MSNHLRLLSLRRGKKQLFLLCCVHLSSSSRTVPYWRAGCVSSFILTVRGCLYLAVVFLFQKMGRPWVLASSHHSKRERKRLNRKERRWHVSSCMMRRPSHQQGEQNRKKKKASAVFSTYSESVMTGGLPKAKRGTSAFKTRRTTDQGRYIITIISVSLK